MNRSVFLDASAWLAAVSAREPRHGEVSACYADLLRSSVRLVTTNLVLAEMHALLVRQRGPAPALKLLDVVRDDQAHELVMIDEELHSAAIDRWIRRFGDQPFSLADATSFEVMRRLAIAEALTLDHHFAVAGFQLLPAPPARHRPKRG